ncbi:MAG: lipopolysaccharide biosynthesis protein [Verrucomicrobia bacterium]|jgi:O-antigen/teichoic acid export membrane protein|nr:lipopolysaccharide biosynthesis protein [Verrucomicrobiota bacterium]
MLHAAHHRLQFFRQSGWMLLATTLGGICMWAVHIPAQRFMPKPEYGVFVTMLQVMNLMLIPAIGLQTVFAQQTAAATTDRCRHQLAFTVRRLLFAVLMLWLAAAAGAWVFRAELLTKWKIANPATLWLTLGVGLAMLWWPIFQGVLQGRQNFLWLGSLQMVNGVVRLAGVALIVALLGGWAAGAMVAVFIGFWVSVAVAAWPTRDLCFGRGEPLAWSDWLRRVIPLTLGLGASQFMMAADQIVVQRVFSDEVTGVYSAAGIIGRALVFFTGPLMAVMFPKIVASAARDQRTDVLGQALGATALLGLLAAMACTLLPELPLRIISGTTYLESAPLVPWFAWCMLPLTLSNVLIGSLLARQRYEAVPWLVLIAVLYGAALTWRADLVRTAEPAVAFKHVVQTLGLFSTVLLAVAAWFAWRRKRSGPGTVAEA